ncbi:hypothetical protein C8J95_11213 [Elizabethkingia sp. YR214]|uniref:hypothetical protein n=1 Tax=Elizabethkingia sp. YR214 TaxID=2135667 RepID=UPI000D315CF7|nr:hypothetical protein [Elizabethkingia sp. YR214]PUB25850.1 hypothetical protein C8J95_11213 [Elizabethkingia sp. YR214]
MNNPLQYFEYLLDSDQSESKKQNWINSITNYYDHYITQVDKEKGIVTAVLPLYYSTLDNGKPIKDTETVVSTFYESLENEINSQLNNSKKEISDEIIRIVANGIDPTQYLQLLKLRLSKLQKKSSNYYKNYPFVADKIKTLEFFILENLPNPSITLNNQNPSPSIQTTAPLITNYSSLSFKWDLVNPSDTEQQLTKLYNLLMEAPPLINATKEDFINGFSQREIIRGINWMIIAKNKKCSKTSLIYFLQQLIERSDLMEEPNDFNKKIEYVFRDHNGNPLNNIKQSKSMASANPTQKERLDTIIDTFMEAN